MDMKISMRDAENIIIAMMQWRTRDGKVTAWGMDIQSQMARALMTEGKVTLEVDDSLPTTTEIPIMSR